jgi:Phage integrase, N-terminal SAM-like domain
MKGSVYQRGKTWTYRFLAPERDSATGRYPTISKGSYLTEKEAWKACRDAMREADNGRFVRSSTRTVAQFSGEWLPAIEPTVDATTWQNWKDYANAYVLPRIGGERLQRLNEPQLLKFYAALLAEGRVKRDRNSTMYTFWSEQMARGKSPTPRQVAAAADATIHAARAAVRRFNDGIIPKPSPPGLAPKSVRNIHAMIHRALVDAVAWK